MFRVKKTTCGRTDPAAPSLSASLLLWTGIGVCLFIYVFVCLCFIAENWAWRIWTILIYSDSSGSPASSQNFVPIIPIFKGVMERFVKAGVGLHRLQDTEGNYPTPGAQWKGKVPPIILRVLSKFVLKHFHFVKNFKNGEIIQKLCTVSNPTRGRTDSTSLNI